MKLLFSAVLILGTATFSAFGAMPVAADTSGTFTGASDHITTGGVTITKHADGSATVTLADDFSLDGAPDPRVGFGKDGAYVDGTDIGLLKALKGGQIFTVPASVNVDDFNEVYIWCLKFAVPLGVAKVS